MTIENQKAELRALAKKRRKNIISNKSQRFDQLLVDTIVKLFPKIGLSKAKKPISAYWPIADEIDVRALMFRLVGDGFPVFLPVVAKLNAPLLFRRWKPESKLIKGKFGTLIPGPEEEDGIPSVLFVPLLAFDEKGFRLGYGGGFFDRTLKSLRFNNREAISVGVAFEDQRVEEVPRDTHDQRLDFVVTEIRARQFSTGFDV